MVFRTALTRLSPTGGASSPENTAPVVDAGFCYDFIGKRTGGVFSRRLRFSGPAFLVPVPKEKTCRVFTI